MAVGKSRRNISELMDIRPDYANIEDQDGQLVQIDPDEVETGTVIVVRPGEENPNRRSRSRGCFDAEYQRIDRRRAFRGISSRATG